MNFSISLTVNGVRQDVALEDPLYGRSPMLEEALADGDTALAI